MIIMGVDAGLTAPGFAIVETSATCPLGKVLVAECFIPTVKRGRNIGGKVFKLRKTDFDAERICQITGRMFDLALQYKPEAIIAELPTGGAKSGAAIRGMAFSTAMTVSFTQALKSLVPNAGWPTTVEFITPIDNKKGSTGMAKWDVETEQGKWCVFNAVSRIWPYCKWPHKKTHPTEIDDGKAWAMADGLSCIATYLRKTGKLTQNFY